jgi:cell division protein FtsW
VYGARRWLNLGPLGFQPTELAKLALVLFAADRLTRPGLSQGPEAWKKAVAPVVLAALAGCGLMMLEPDFGSTVLFFLLGALLLICAGLPLWVLVPPAGLAALGAIALVIHSPYRLQRVLTFLHPWADERGHGFQIVHSLMAFGTGGILGMGLGNGIQKLYYLPEPHTDFIFSTAGEEFGLLGCVAVLALFAVLLWRGFLISLHARDPFLKLSALGITAMFGLQVLVNLFVVLGMAPTKGTTLPFLSYGGSSGIINFAAVGLLLNISRRRE